MHIEISVLKTPPARRAVDASLLSLGLISYTLVKVAAGKFREISPVIWILTALFILRYAYLAAE